MPGFTLVLLALSLAAAAATDFDKAALCSDEAAGSTYLLQSEILYLKKEGVDARKPPEDAADLEQAVIDSAVRSIEALHTESNTSAAIRVIIEDAAADAAALERAANSSEGRSQEIADAAEDIKESAKVSVTALKKQGNSTDTNIDTTNNTNDTQAAIHVSIRITGSDDENGSAALTEASANASSLAESRLDNVEREVSRALDGPDKERAHSLVEVFSPSENEVRSGAARPLPWLLVGPLVLVGAVCTCLG
eukprot:gb/GFBE01049979.1/.p1 GENE.gb/GFBE01049979.1/~~gb/GFBE01049979.1/.p1  ORF type:complete len:251 (+),score=65.88 gb/GFBE01049979.1/:1-753(+)